MTNNPLHLDPTSNFQFLRGEMDILLKENAILARKNYDLKKQNAELVLINEDLNSRLALYENPHTPPSAQRLKKEKKKKKSKGSRKRGAPKGHKGVTRPTPPPDRVVEVTTELCEKCGSSNLEEKGITRKTIEEMPPPPKIEVIQFNRRIYSCSDCGHDFVAKHEECPQQGRFGVNTLMYLTMQKYSLRGVLRKIGDFTSHMNHFKISPKGIQDAIFRVGKACEEEYKVNIKKVRNAQWNYIDETSMKVLGKKYWLWLFRTNKNEVVVCIRPSRGQKVLKEIFGNKPTNPGVTDGWRAYNLLPALQRCWSHLLREVDNYTDKKGGTELSDIIHEKFDALKEFQWKNPPPSTEERIQQKITWDVIELSDLVKQFEKYDELKKPVTYIKNGLEHWYTCLLYPGMQPTNNLGEQAIREHVIMRKIIGTFRSETGPKYYQYTASLFATWKLQEKNIYHELKKLLTQKLCLKPS